MGFEGARVAAGGADATVTLGSPGDADIANGTAVALGDGRTVATVATAAVAARTLTRVMAVAVLMRVGSIGRSLPRWG
jgi:hypothetical protein